MGCIEKLDKIDLRIIHLLQENARYPLKYLAEQVYLSTPAVSSRIEKLESAGIIKGYTAQIDNFKLGFNITAFINLEVSPKEKEVFYPFINECPNVIECNCVTGKYSMLIKVAFHSTMELDAFIGKLQKFGVTETQIVFSTAVEHRNVNLDKIK
ncbi:MAG: Lrp/AsnC family transcriptional regulator [Clostridiales bacterium]|nr:Lrp/AsnC family transcriptional regulator [Clostridiales bacterium]